MTARSPDADDQALLYRDGGAGDVPGDNEAQWRRWAIWPRTVLGVQDVDVSASIAGLSLDLPVVVAPSALHGLWHERAEAETAAGTRGGGSVLALSHASTLPPEEAVLEPYLQQLYLPQRRDLVLPLVRRAEDAGAAALVLTVDQLPVPYSQPFREAARHLPAPGWSAWEASQPGAAPARSFSPDDVAWLASRSRLPIIAKGILHPADARAVVDAGAAAVVVSNHGGRQLAGSVTPAEVLREVTDAVAGAVPVHVDSGVRGAADVFRALCLGASTAWVGRPILWQLERGGAPAIEAWLHALRDELASIFALVGVRTPADCGPNLLRDRGTVVR